MMYGSIFYNFWGALGSFTGYFIWAMQQSFPMPLPVVVQSFLAAIIGFIFMFVVRYFLGYVFYTPTEMAYSEILEQENVANEESDFDLLMRSKKDSAVEFPDEDSEEIAQVVRTMLHGQGEPASN